MAGLKAHAVEHRFHVHDERHLIDTYSLRQSWEVDVHPEEACGQPLDLHLALDVDPRVLLSLQDALEEMGEDWAEPEDEFQLGLFFNWGVPPLEAPPDLLVLATDLAGLGGPELPIEVSSIETLRVADEPERSLTIVGKAEISLVKLLLGREQNCEQLDRARDVSLYLLSELVDTS